LHTASFYATFKTKPMSNFITLQQAVAMTTNYRNEKENILAPAYKGTDILPLSETFDRASFDALLAETDAQYIRVYLAMDADLKTRLIAVAANSKNVDILPSATGAAALDGGPYIVEDGIRCPPNCQSGSPLNP
jgi:hypothetical protein